MSSLNIQQNIPLAQYTTFKIGGPAKFFCEVKNEKELLEALQYAKDNSLKFFALGGGSNILVSDDGFDGLMIHIQDTRDKIQDTKIECGAGLKLSEAVKIATDNSLTGMEWAVGIPGTIGGAVQGNAGAFGFSMSDITENVKVLDGSNLKVVISNSDKKPKYQLPVTNYINTKCQFGYRTSLFKENHNLIVVSVTLKLQKGDKAEIEAKIKENLEKRVEKQPRGLSAGSFFKNPVVKNSEIIKRFEKDTGMKIKDDKLPAGWLIEEAGFLGKKVGNVQVSENHGNFVINLGEGKAEEVIILASLIKQKVREKFNIQLMEEVQLVGF